MANYQRHRDLVIERLGALTDVTRPGGAFYAFVKVPQRLGKSAGEFCEAAIERSLLTIPGNVFSARDTHVRLSYAVKTETLSRGLDVLTAMMK